MREQLPSFEGKLDMYADKLTLEEQRAELWGTFEQMPKTMDKITADVAPWNHPIGDDYEQSQFVFRERGATGFESDPRLKEIFVSLEYMIEEVIGKQKIDSKKMDMYKGTVKKWQVLDDKGFDREEIVKIQAAIRAPLPEELELYQEKHNRPMQLPITNVNVSAWRDD